MRSHVKASSAATTQGRASGRGFPADSFRYADGIGASVTARLVLAASLLIVLFALGATPAGAAPSAGTHRYLEDFGSAAQPGFSNVTSLAVDQSSGDVLVLDAGANTISRYHADGTAADFSALGTNVIDGFDVGDETPEGGLELAGTQQIAIDNSGTLTDGDIYVTQASRQEVYIFSSAGAYLGKLSQYKEGADADGPLASFWGGVCGVAVDSTGAVYVNDGAVDALHKYVPTANPPVDTDNTSILTSSFGGLGCRVAVGAGSSAGFVFSNREGPETNEVSKRDSSTGKLQYRVASGAGAVSVDPSSGDVFVTTSNGFKRFDVSGASNAMVVASVSGLEGHAGEAIAVDGSSGRVYLAESGHSQLRVFGPFGLHRAVTGGPASVGANSAVANGLVRPEGEQVLGCEFEYGSTAAYGSSAPCSPSAASIAADLEVHGVSAALQGLDPFTAYHYRLSFTTAAGTFTGEDVIFRTMGGAGLPDNRRYEQVSPTEKNGYDIYQAPGMASVNGNRLFFTSAGAFAGAPTAVLSGVQYLSKRGPDGWRTESISIPTSGTLSQNSGYSAFTPDLSKGVIGVPEESQLGTYDPDAQPGFNLYLRDFGQPNFTLLNGTLSEAGGWSTFLGLAAWGSSDFSHLAIASPEALTPEGASVGCNNNHFSSTAQCVYEWDNGALRLASIVDGQPVQGTVGGAPGPGAFEEGCSTDHAMSDDGARLFFTSPPNRGDVGRLYARENGTNTTLISGSERTLPGGFDGQRANFLNADAAHGDQVIFTTKNSLLDADNDETNDLYLYDYTKPAGQRLTLVSEDQNPNAPLGAKVDGGGFESKGCGGMLGASEDLRRIYFVTDNQILPGEPEAEGPKLYLWDDTGATPHTTYLGALTTASGGDQAWRGATTGIGVGNYRTARVTADGTYLTFLSSAKLTDFDNEGREEVYRYSTASESLVCASCSADASPANGEISFETHTGLFIGQAGIYNHFANNLTADGRVFFQTTRGLVPADSNGKMDVYEYVGGHPRLISLGEGSSDSLFLDASPSGSDVFFTTKDRLVGWDRDDNADAYDARVGGGFPEPPLLAAACQGDACQPAPVPPNDATPASSAFEGAGNVSEPRARGCAKGKVRREGKCRKRKPARSTRRTSKSATRSHG